MYVIGTAGHVDHGKTLLIEALTGINADRLPEEKERGMTIDLGFAHFEGENGELIGVIDVPGHERFIRNMVAGAWSLSCALLLVAADDGWMAQSGDHALVLEALRVPRVILVITKKDLASEERIREISVDIANRTEAIFGRTLPRIAVSAKTGENIPLLKRLIEETVFGIPAIRTAGPPCMYVDRVFNMKGAGTIVTGSLTGGSLETGEAVFMLPGDEKANIRGIQSYNSGLARAAPVSRVALNLQGVRKDDLKRGILITTAKNAYWSGREFIIHISPPASGERQPEQLKNNMELELSFGTANVIARFYRQELPDYARVVLQEEVAAAWNQPCVLIRHGGSVILGKGFFVWPGETTREERKKLMAVFAAYGNALSSLTSEEFTLLARGWHDSATLAVSSSFPAKVLQSGSAFLLDGFFKMSGDRIVSMAGKEGGVTRAELAGNLALPRAVLDFVLSKTLADGRIASKGSVYVPPDLAPGEGLSKTGEALVAAAARNGKNGVELKTLSQPGAQKELRNLVRLGIFVALEDGIYYLQKTYDELKSLVLSGKTKGSRLSVPEAKDRTGLSRKYVLPLLNKMEEEGLVKRDGNERIVC